MKSKWHHQNGKVGLFRGPFTETTNKLEKMMRINYFRLWTLIKHFKEVGEYLMKGKAAAL